MADMPDAVPPDEPLTATDQSSGARRVLHWYDFLCPFCYVGQQRNRIFESHGFEVVAIPFEAHPDIPIGGRAIGKRNGPMYAHIETEARAAGLPLFWPDRLPNTRSALAAAEWTRRHAPQSFPVLEKALFAAHFALGEDLGDRRTIDRHAAKRVSTSHRCMPGSKTAAPMPSLVSRKRSEKPWAFVARQLGSSRVGWSQGFIRGSTSSN
jgi:hypothetical protein